MGNQREIRQASPRSGLGVAIPVRIGHSTDAKELAETQEHRGLFYTYFCPAGEPIEILNMDGPTVCLGPFNRDYVVIQSGGKMWCGYAEFIERIRSLCPHLEDALFFVADEENYIDEFLIKDGRLQYQRLLQGAAWNLTSFLAERHAINHHA
jgi:hypothetical protein